MISTSEILADTSQSIMHIDTQTINTKKELDGYWDMLFDIPGLLLQWVVTWALPEIYVDLIDKRKTKGLPTFIISSGYYRDGIELWNYESIQRNKDVGGVYLEWANLKDLSEVCEVLAKFVLELKSGVDLEKSMLEKFGRKLSVDQAINDLVSEL